MKTSMSKFRVTGPVSWRGYKPGEEVTIVEDDSVQRAVAIGTLTLLEEGIPARFDRSRVRSPRRQPAVASDAGAVSEPEDGGQ